ncbi:hypothetical protein GCM10019071_34870 [Sphingobium fuliginis]|uniref:Uncharacterized protein n=2 Tax=Sphingobium fuliginis (strain ATCC 27551) TaxID=336203 RepID=A0ABQ1F823_SPHSA|nr:hypothetical protein GCM10019071_34870 [Sphingobium fuliginis]
MMRSTERKEARLDRPSMTGGEAAIKARGCPPIFCENRFPPRPLRGATLRSAALTAPPPPVSQTPFSIVRTVALEISMGMVQGIGTASNRISDTLVAGLELEFGRGVGEALVRRFLDAEEVDFHWDARALERWIGAYQSADDEDFELDRIAICGQLNGEWFCATMLVDGDAQAHGMTGCRQYGSKMQARKAMSDAH